MKTGVIAVLLLLLLAGTASAHVTNEATLYDDIQQQPARESIVVLNGLRVIASDSSGVNLFYPNDPLTRRDLAFWSGTFWRLMPEESTVEEVAQAAVDQGLVGSLEELATYEDVSKAYFQGALQIDEAKRNESMTREQFAVFMSRYLEQPVDGATLYAISGLTEGPKGTIEDVVRQQRDYDGKTSHVYQITVNGKTLELSGHPRVLRGPVDLSLWKGKAIEQSWLSEGDGGSKIQVLVAEPGQFDEKAVTVGATAAHTHADSNEHAGHETSRNRDAGDSMALTITLAAGLALLVSLAGWLMIRKPRMPKA